VTPVLCLITDRRWSGTSAEDDLIARVEAAARAGVHLIQVRERDLDGGPLTRLVARCVGAVARTPTRVVVNERTDVALAAGAHGVHLRGDSLPAARVRAIVPPGFLIGRSVHSVAEVQAVAAEGAVDYLLFGTVFPTSSKPGRPSAGTAMLAAAVRAATIPVLAVGGVRAETAGLIAGAGAAGAAAIGLFAEGPVESLQVAVSAVNMAFDTPIRLP
jgi:thiamine-phosphate pyrophosphorylase